MSTPATRTEAEASRSNQLKANATVRKAYTLSNPYELDLTCLPVETKFKICTLEDSFGTIVVNDNEADVESSLGMFNTLGTLRQVKWNRHGYGTDNWLGLNINMPSNKGTRAKAKVVRALPNGLNSIMRAIRNEITSHNVIDCEKARQLLFADQDALSFIGQHTLSFQGVIRDKVNATYLGLPRGTLIPTKPFSMGGGRPKTTGLFQVNQRANLSVEGDGSVTGHLHLVAMDVAADKLATRAGWGREIINGVDGYLAPANLHTGLGNGAEVVITGISVPFFDPLTNYQDILPGSAPLKHRAHVPVAGEPAKVWASTPEELEEQLAGFLFG